MSRSGVFRRHPVRTSIAVVVLAPIVFVAANLALLMADRREVGGWKSPAAEQRFNAAYDEVMALMPPSTAHDFATDFGTVRAYRFEKPGADAAYRARTPLLLLPGHSAPAPLWLGDLPILLEDRPVWALDLLGQPGKSVQTRRVADGADQARWLDQVITQTREPRLHLVGLSFGGWTAVNHAIRHPRVVASLSLADPALVFGMPPAPMMIASMFTTFPLMPKAYNDWFVEWINGAPVDPSVPEAKIVTAGIDEYAVRQPVPEVPTDEQLRSLRMPVMTVIGGRSEVNDADVVVPRARAMIPGIDITVDPDAGHGVNGEAFDRRVLAFVAGVD
ncbi:alpha/beta fold hydrolase [Mariniluteicoccus flavus]